MLKQNFSVKERIAVSQSMSMMLDACNVKVMGSNSRECMNR